MQPTYFINHGGGPCFFLDLGPMNTEGSKVGRVAGSSAATRSSVRQVAFTTAESLLGFRLGPTKCGGDRGPSQLVRLAEDSAALA